MASPSAPPKLTPQFCFTTVALRDFLRISRSAIDDSITQNLNALATPAQRGFDPNSTSIRNPRADRPEISPGACQSWKDEVLFPSWQARSDVLTYCASVATSPDPDDPEVALRINETAKNQEKVVDERLDPYSGRYFPREVRTERLAMLLRQERGVENIVRSRTWDAVKRRCGDDCPAEAEEALNQWRNTKGRR
ncbi:putative caffeine-induced death protein Cid2 [Xylariaceae sp. FL0804]|nr:putative caffeine-induced death protein Cid2 [Xylariaceae sp. FL0804]